LRVAVLASGRGTDFQSIIDGIKRGDVDAEIVLLLTNNPEAGAIERAKANGIPVAVIPNKAYRTRLEHDRAVRGKLDEAKPGLVVLAGYMRVIHDKDFLKAYHGKMINIHPSLLPAFENTYAPHTQQLTFDKGVKVSGLTVHFVGDVDQGEIVYQEAVDVSDCATVEALAERLLEREHAALPKVVQMFAQGSFCIQGRRVAYVPRQAVR